MNGQPTATRAWAWIIASIRALLSKPLRGAWRNFALYLATTLGAGAALFAASWYSPLRGNTRSALEIGEALAFGLLFAAFVAAQAHGAFKDRRTWPAFDPETQRYLAERAGTLLVRLHEETFRWITGVAIMHTLVFGLIAWTVENMPVTASPGLDIVAASFTALSLVCLIGAMALANAGSTSRRAHEYVIRVGPKEPVALFLRHVYGWTPLRAANLLLPLGFAFLGTCWLMFGVAAWVRVLD